MSKTLDFIILEKTDSTNAYLKEKIRSGEIFSDTALLALAQEKGRGRLSRAWHSERGKSLTMSLALKSPLSPALTLLCALGVYEVLSEIRKENNLQIKWPNDIISNGKKLCGILTERVGDFTVIGIGLNVNNESFPTEISQKATSLYILSGKSFDINALWVKIAESVKKTLAEYDFTLCDEARNKYKSLCVNLGKEAQFGEPLKKGIAEDILSTGELLVHTEWGYEKISFGDVFVSGIY